MKLFFTVFLCLLTYGGLAQVDGTTLDKSLLKIYTKYVESEYDYDGRDSILQKFKKKLQSTLQDERFKDYKFPIWDKKKAVVTSSDGNLTIFSWDWENNGPYHIYESMYRYLAQDTIHTDFLYEYDKDVPESFTVVYYKIYEMSDSSYLLKGWGTHGSGKEYLLLRKMNPTENGLVDCNKCFNGSDYFMFEYNRSDDYDVIYDTDTNTITFPKLIPILDPEGGDSGFLKHSGETIIWQFKKGSFVPQR